MLASIACRYTFLSRNFRERIEKKYIQLNIFFLILFWHVFKIRRVLISKYVFFSFRSVCFITQYCPIKGNVRLEK